MSRLTTLLFAATFALAAAAAPAPARAQSSAPAAAPMDSTALPQVGQAAPDFSLASTAGGTQKLDKLKGRTVVLYFYPKDETPGCTKEACDFRDHRDDLKRAGVVVLGVSMDDLASHRRFRAKEKLTFPLLADTDGRVSRAYGVLRQRERDGKSFTYIERTTFVIDKTGHIARVWPRVSVSGHVEDVLAFVRGS